MANIDDIIKKAQERGDFDNLRGHGKPQDLRVNPFVPPDWRLGFDMLASNGLTPEVVESNKAIREHLAALEKKLASFARRWDATRGTPMSKDAANRRLAARDTFLQEYESELRAINSRIHTFNISAPSGMARGSLRLAELLAAAAERLRVD